MSDDELKNKLYDLFIVQCLSRKEIANILCLGFDKIKRSLKKFNITRRNLVNCIICNESFVFSMARCRACYRELPKVKNKEIIYNKKYLQRPEIKLRNKNNNFIYNKINKDKRYAYKQTSKYKAYQKKYNEAYRQKHGYLKRPALYWQNRWAKIQESDGCEVCHSHEELEAHHIKAVKDCKKLGLTEEEMHSRDNLQILCRLHHRGKDNNRNLHWKENI